MAIARVNDVDLYFEITGNGEPLVLVHGSWGDHHNWDAVSSDLAKSFRVVTYDRRGHSRSERPTTQGNLDEDARDLVALIEYLGVSPTHIAGNSGGAAVTLRAAAARPDVFRTMIVHEPALFGLLAGEPQAQPALQVVGQRIAAVTALLERGEMAAGARLFVETIAFGPGEWERLPHEMQETFIFNAPTFLDEVRDRDGLTMDLAGLARFDKRALLTQGEASPPFFPMVVAKVANALPHGERRTIAGAGHVPHVTHPQDYVRMVLDFAGGISTPLAAM